MRTIGIEEELLLVDPETGRPVSVAGVVLRRASSPEERERAGLVDLDESAPGGEVTSELQRQQLEIDTPPRTGLLELDRDLRQWRGLAVRAARKAGARVLASATSPMPVRPEHVHSARYDEMMHRFGATAAEHLLCGCHVHVSVGSDEEAVAVLDRIRVWLPSLLAISANSPFWQGRDSGYASFRSQALIRWPSAGPTELFGSAEAYHRTVSDMVASEVLLDADMVYFDARLSGHYPTVEIRVTDVCADARDAVLIAGLCRGLVETAARQWADGDPCPSVPTAMLRLATWQAGHDGVDGALLDPSTYRPRPAAEVLDGLVDQVRPALEDAGDLALVEERLHQVLARGNGARRQRSVLRKTNRLIDVVTDLAGVTEGHDARGVIGPAEAAR